MTNHVPAWVDISKLCEEICACPNTVAAWVEQGILPPARMRGGKRLWKWSEVDAYLTNGAPSGSLDEIAERIRNGTRRAAAEGRADY
jgi:hypothetical protein